MNNLLTARRQRILGVLVLLMAPVVLVVQLVDPSVAMPDRGAPPSLGGLPKDGDGSVGDVRITIDDKQHPAISGLDPDLRTAVEAASRSANRDGIQLLITSGWRSEGYQQRLFERAVKEHGSEAEARRWVATPQKSAHVRGEAVDIGRTDAAYWMVQHGSEFGLCQVYANEVWHYELLTSPGGTCPEMKTDGA